MRTNYSLLKGHRICCHICLTRDIVIVISMKRNNYCQMRDDIISPVVVTLMCHLRLCHGDFLNE